MESIFGHGEEATEFQQSFLLLPNGLNTTASPLTEMWELWSKTWGTGIQQRKISHMWHIYLLTFAEGGVHCICKI